MALVLGGGLFGGVLLGGEFGGRGRGRRGRFLGPAQGAAGEAHHVFLVAVGAAARIDRLGVAGVDLLLDGVAVHATRERGQRQGQRRAARAV